jgi:sec-independent protein translocase protein TatA
MTSRIARRGVFRPARGRHAVPLSDHQPEEDMLPGSIGIPELLIVLVIVLVIFGPKRLPGMGRSLGAGMREFKDSISGKSKDEDDEDKPRLTEADEQIADATRKPARERVES